MEKLLINSDKYQLQKQNHDKTYAEYISENANIPLEFICGNRDCINNWYHIDNKWYYYKENLSLFHFLNELLGEKISEQFNLKTVHYKIAERDSEIGLISENFCKKNHTYIRPLDIGIERKPNLSILDNIKNICKEEEYKILKDQLTALFIRDFYSSQEDRTNYNLLFEKGKTIKLAPLYDYEYSFKNSSYFINKSVIGVLNIYDENTKFILKKDPNAQKYLCILMDINIISIIKDIEEEYNFKFPDEYKSHYIDRDNKIKTLIKNLKIK